ncbi:MAG: spermidine synthase [Myxococcota bacterium]
MEPTALTLGGLGGATFVAVTLLLPPALLHGATLPAAAAALERPSDVAALYAANTSGAVLGALLAAFLLMPAVGVRGTELIAAGLGATAGIGALLSRPAQWQAPAQHSTTHRYLPTGVLAAAALAGGAAMALEVVWSRLAALLIGGSVYAMSIVLAVFLAGVALGAAWGQRAGVKVLRPALAALGVLAVAGTASWRLLPHGLALGWSIAPDNLLLTGAILLAVAMAGAPVASGMVFSACLQADPDLPPEQAAGQVLGANTLGSVLGVSLAGLWGMPALGIRGVVLLIGVTCVITAASLPLPVPRSRRWWAPAAVLAALVVLTPRWQPELYAVGLYNRIGEFVDFSPRAVESFARDGWTMRYYIDGRTTSVAVGQSTRTDNRWLSLNGKVDASTGADMATQQLSGSLPVSILQRQGIEVDDALVVGLASGVTAAEVLRAGAAHVTVIELEPAVLAASRHFAHVNGTLHEDPRATIRVDDARAVLARPGRDYPVIISEPSNPWLTGVSNLFTLEYWRSARQRLSPDGVFCQWVQLYALPPEALRSLVQTFITVFPQSWLFETIPGADAILIGMADDTAALPPDLALEPILGPRQLRALGRSARLNTDDRPWIEFEAPRWVNRSTGARNRALIEEATAR